MAKPVDVPSGQHLTLSAGDLDKAVAGLLTNGMVATDVNGAGMVAGGVWPASPALRRSAPA